MARSTPYTNDKKDGIEEVYNYDHTSGRVYLSDKNPYKLGQIHGTVERYNMRKGVHSLMDSTPYVNGSVHGVTESYVWMTFGDSRPDKRFLRNRTVFAHGKIVKSIHYDINGNIL